METGKGNMEKHESELLKETLKTQKIEMSCLNVINSLRFQDCQVDFVENTNFDVSKYFEIHKGHYC